MLNRERQLEKSEIYKKNYKDRRTSKIKVDERENKV
jgi:hypothetical protein